MKNLTKKLFFWEKLFVIAIVVVLINMGSVAMGEIKFEETTHVAGISIENQTYGSAWGDVNGDNWPDLFAGNHFLAPKLYLNNQDGTFTDISLSLGLDSFTREDFHGSSWVDFDNDGNQDLLVLVGAEKGRGQGSNLLLKNEEGFLKDYASEYGLDFPYGRARAPVWFDWDNDGLLDLIITNLPRPDGKAPSSFFHQTQSGFENLTPKNEFKIIRPYGAFQIHAPNNMTHVFYFTPFMEGIYNLSNFPNQTLKDPLSLRNPGSVDLAISDFNGDLLLDIFQTKSELESYFIVEDSKNIFTRLLLREAGEQSLQIHTSSTIMFNSFIPPSTLNLTDIHIGSKGYNPDNSFFFLESSNRKAWGILNHISGVDKGLYIGYDPNNRFWEIQHSSDIRSKLEFEINSKNAILDIIYSGAESDHIFSNNQLLIQAKSRFTDQTNKFGLDTPVSCGSIGAGDFDNDMDLDIYLICSLSTKNLPNILYENIGNKNFVAVENIGDIAGSNLGIGDSVSIADYDGDGFLDLFVTNGAHSSSFSNIGPSHLFKNIGNENHWLEIDLEGTISNRDGIGARVYITANGVTQVREQSGGIHYRSQDFQRIHFGLGPNELVESLFVHWPSGIIQEMKNISADQIIRIVEQTPIGSPKFQISMGIIPTDVKCRNDLVLILKNSNNSPACVTLTTLNKLIERGWGDVLKSLINSEELPTPIVSTIVEDFEFGHGWISDSDELIMNDDTSVFVEGLQSLQIGTDTNQNTHFITSPSLSKIDFTKKSLGVWIKTSNPVKHMNKLHIELSSSGNFTNDSLSFYLMGSAPGKTIVRNGEWRLVTLPWNEGVQEGGPTNREEITKIRFESKGTSAPATINIDAIVTIDEPSEHAIVLGFDDGHESTYHKAFPKMNEYGFKGIIYTIYDLIDTPNFLSWSQLQQLQTAGWDIGIHGIDSWTSYGPVKTQKQIIELKSALYSHGITRGLDHASYPKGSNNEYIRDAVQELLTTGRSTSNHHETSPPSDPMLLRAQKYNSGIPTSEIKARIDTAIASGEYLQIYFHDIVTSSATDFSTNQVDFDDIIDYLNTTNANVVTMTEYVNQITSMKNQEPLKLK